MPTRSSGRGAGRGRMVESAAVLLGAHGVTATSFSEVLAHSGAPRGSIYYYFPGGKAQLVRDSVEWTADQVLSYQRACPSRTPAGALTHFVDFFRRSVVSSHCRAGCPIAAVAIGSLSPEVALQSAVRAGFRSWTDLLTSQLVDRGLRRPRARALATVTVSAVEGALILCRAEGRVAPLDAVRRHLRQAAT